MISELAANKSVNYLKKCGIVIFIFSSLGSHFVHNTPLKSPIFPNLFGRLTALTRMSDQWRMFSVVDRFSWRLEIVAIHESGKAQTLPIFAEQEKEFFEKQFIDFREGKLHHNLFIYPDARYHYSDYLCRMFQNETNPIQAIRYDLFWRQILPPQQAAIREQYLTEEFSDLGKLGEYQCQN
ncbi:hypothetical protein [Crocosphaera chwakensis]|uniref:Uncharacterized protein n=1 Tax=Crocosphaera chwakensis CCY0110 TaxID=391612 RepID=A3ITM7_9CHRO|nr:hypothetical protein [Crocosphaera chwakensis]EAZ90208.1 hypothetical protein CY0110_30698 [Crocosphaera chwakensis CCY0110]